MAEPFISEMRMFSYNWPPEGWAKCDGQELPISQNPALASLLGTHFGGNGSTTFGLPDLRGRVPMAYGGQMPLGYAAGFENVTITSATMAAWCSGLPIPASASRPRTCSA